jgi:hypothetical protein
VRKAIAIFLIATPALAQDAPKEQPAWQPSKRPYFQVIATTLIGDGLRFNNPYRLATPLGSSAESVSRTAAYVDLGVGATLGKPEGLQHGASLRLSLALEGVQQTVFVPSYLAWYRRGALAAYGRVGVPIVFSPQPTWGFEGALGGAFFVRSGIGFALELVGDVFYGAGTRERSVVSYPVLSAQAGLILAYEVLP